MSASSAASQTFSCTDARRQMPPALIDRATIAERTTYKPGRIPDLAVVIPTLNERGNIATLVGRLDAALEALNWEAVFVDDNSSDGTPDAIVEIARSRPDIRLLRRFGRRGLSSAVIEGMLSTTAPFVAVIDADLQHDEAILPDLYRAVADDRSDLAIGSRYIEGGSAIFRTPRRTFATSFATSLSRFIVKTPLSDPMSGYFVIRQDIVVGLAPRLTNVGFKILLDIVTSAPRDLRIQEIPYHFRERKAGKSKLDTAVALEYAYLLIEKASRGWISPRLILFVCVGSFGLAVNLVILRLVLALTHGQFALAQTLAVVIVIALNFKLNNVLTYRDQRLRGGAFLRGLASFYLICGIGAFANIAIAKLVYAQSSAWWIAGISGALIGAGWNYVASSLFTWKKHKR